MRVQLTTIALSFVTMTAAIAADLPVRPAPATPYLAPAPVNTWSGFYFGLNSGYGWGRARFELPGVATSSSFDGNGGILGSTLGFNLQGGPWVFGLETDINVNWFKGTVDAVPPCSSCELSSRWFGTFRGRGGYDFNGWLLYATGGLAYGDIRVSDTFGNVASRTGVGWTVGGGIEYAFDRTWSGKLEYLYLAYADETGFGGGLETHRFNENIVRVGINARFSQIGR